MAIKKAGAHKTRVDWRPNTPFGHSDDVRLCGTPRKALDKKQTRVSSSRTAVQSPRGVGLPVRDSWEFQACRIIVHKLLLFPLTP